MTRFADIKEAKQLPESVKRSLGIGKFKAKILEREDGELIAKVTQDFGQVIISLTYIKGQKAFNIEITEEELSHILLMAKDLRKITEQSSDDPINEAELKPK